MPRDCVDFLPASRSLGASSQTECRMSKPRNKPRVSVVMPVYNALPHLDEAVGSILEQTHADFEFVIYDDASTDGSWERLQDWADADNRIRLFRGERNLGPAASSNEVVRRSEGRLIARMDADDISMPDRLQRQIEILEDRPDVGLIGALCEVIDSEGRNIRGPEFWRLTRRSPFTPFPHGTIMLRREVFDAVGGYRDECEFWEDLDLVLRIGKQSKILVLATPLYFYRQSSNSTRIASDQDRVERAVDLRYRSLARLQQERRYGGHLEDSQPDKHPRVDPRVFISLGSLVLWSNGRPQLVRRLLSRGRLGFDKATATAMVWTVWASVSPSTLRGVMQLVSRIRNAAVRKSSLRDSSVEWVTPG